jgi:hypothetical protein
MPTTDDRDMLIEIVETWTATQLDNYIIQLKARHKRQHMLIRALSAVHRKKVRQGKKLVVDTGSRDGR